MTAYPAELTRRFAAQLSDVFRRVRLLEQRTAGIDAGMPLAVLPAVIDPAYVSGDPKALINGSSALTGPYKHLSSYTPVASDPVLVVPVPATGVALTATYVVLGKYL